MSVDGISNSNVAALSKAPDPALQAAESAVRSVDKPSSKPVVSIEPVETSFKVNEKTNISSEDLHRAVDQLNLNLQKMNRDVNFSVDSATGRDVVRVTNSNTGEVVRQLPYVETLNFLRNLENMMGLIFDQKT